MKNSALILLIIFSLAHLSAISKNSSKNLISAKMVLDSVQIYFWDTNDYAWKLNSRKFLAYDEKGNNTVERDIYLASENKWKNDRLYMYTYDLSNNKISYIEQSWNSITNDWEKTNKYYTVYDNNNHELSTTHMWWNKTYNMWNFSYKDTIIYANNVKKEIRMNWSNVNKKWINVTKTISGNFNSGDYYEINYLWVDSAKKWLNNDSTIYTYNKTGQCIGSLYFKWTNNYWEKSRKDSFSYDNNGNRISETSLYWNTLKNSWKPFQRSTYTFNKFNLNTGCMYEQWDTNTDIISYTEKYTYEYDIYGNMTYKTIYFLDTANNEYLHESRFNYYYSQHGTGIKTELENSESLYPNPAQSILYFKNSNNISKIEIYDTRGRRLQEKENICNSLDIRSLSKGAYFIKLYDKSGVKSLKFLKE